MSSDPFINFRRRKVISWIIAYTFSIFKRIEPRFSIDEEIVINLVDFIRIYTARLYDPLANHLGVTTPALWGSAHFSFIEFHMHHRYVFSEILLAIFLSDRYRLYRNLILINLSCKHLIILWRSF